MTAMVTAIIQSPTKGTRSRESRPNQSTRPQAAHQFLDAGLFVIKNPIWQIQDSVKTEDRRQKVEVGRSKYYKY